MDRMEKINQMFKREISAMILLGEIKDPRIKFVTITYADVSKDLSWAHMGFSVLSDNPDDIREVQQGLNSASGMVRRLMGQRITLRHIPQVKFVYDDTIARSAHMTKVFDDIHKERVARGVEPAPEVRPIEEEEA
jgi:ribosome-binding factor A